MDAADPQKNYGTASSPDKVSIAKLVSYSAIRWEIMMLIVRSLRVSMHGRLISSTPVLK